jgi:hypothetical protein
MSDLHRDGSRLATELAQLRTAIGAVEAPAPDEAALRALFRSRERSAGLVTGATVATAASGKGAWRMHAAAAAVVVLALGAVLAAVLTRVERPVLPPVANEVPAREALPVGAFQPLLNSPALSSSSYSVVRVRIPLSALALVPGTEQDGTIEADLLVGDDGLARAIRFNEADAVRVAAARQ